MLPVECPEPLPGAKSLMAAPDPTVPSPQPPALQPRGSAAPLAAAAPAQQHKGAAEGADEAVPGSSEVAGTWEGCAWEMVVDMRLGTAVGGLSALPFSPENRQSPAGPQQAHPAVPEHREESIRGSG